MYYYNNEPATFILEGDPSSNIEIFPEDIDLLLDKKYGKNAILNTWAHCAQIKAQRDNSGKTTLTISWDGYRIEIPVADGMPIFIGVRKTYVKTGAVRLPRHLNDQIAWALGLRSFQQKELKELLEDLQFLRIGTMMLAYGYSGYTPYPDLLNLAFNGPITRLDAIKALETCLENRLYHGHPYKIRYLLNILKK